MIYKRILELLCDIRKRIGYKTVVLSGNTEFPILIDGKSYDFDELVLEFDYFEYYE